MKKLLIVGIATLGLLNLTACQSESSLLDFFGSITINDEVVFTTDSSIDEMKVDTSDGGFSAHANDAIDTMLGTAIGDKNHNGTDSCYTFTKYPVVLVHGLYGFDKVLGVDYWYRVIEAIELGGGEAYTIPVPKLNSTEVRGEHLRTELLALKATLEGTDINSTCGNIDRTNNPVKFHLMGHSHGGPTVRYIIDTNPELLASVTTIGGLNAYGIQDSPTMEKFSKALTSFAYGPLLQGMLNGLAELIEFVGGNKENHTSYAVASFESLSKEGIAEFNTQHNIGLPPNYGDGYADHVNNNYCDPSNPAHPGNHGVEFDTVAGHDIYFFSWSGTGTGTNVLDPTDVLVNYVADSVGAPSDGMVEQCASHFGTVLRSDYDLNHLDQINWVMGLRRATATNPLVIYRQTTNRLKLIEAEKNL